MTEYLAGSTISAPAPAWVLFRTGPRLGFSLDLGTSTRGLCFGVEPLRVTLTAVIPVAMTMR